VAATLAPYAWREFTERMLVRRVLGAVDQQEVIGLLAGIPGTDVGVVGAVEPAEGADERLDVLLSALDGQQWRGWSLARLCAELIASLEGWHAERDSLETDLRRLLDDH
jgi:hypothetical protein